MFPLLRKGFKYKRENILLNKCLVACAHPANSPEGENLYARGLLPFRGARGVRWNLFSFNLFQKTFRNAGNFFSVVIVADDAGFSVCYFFACCLVGDLVEHIKPVLIEF
jgi:hypothetical protein